MAINPKIKQKAEDIRSKIFGSEVRESLASGIEAISEDVEATKERQITVEETMQTVIDETTGKDVISAPEIIAAHVDSNGTAHPNLKSRLDNFEVSATQQLAQTTQLLNDTIDGEIQAVLNNVIVQTDIENKLNAKEVEYAPRLSEVENNFSNITNKYTKEEISTVDVTFTSGYWFQNEKFENTDYYYTNKFPVQKGDIITCTRQGITQPLRFIDAYNGDTLVSSTSETNSYTVPNGVDNLIVTVYSVGIEEKLIRKKSMVTVYDLKIDKKRFSFTATADTLASNAELVVAQRIDNKKNCSYLFNGFFSTFDSLKIGHGKTEYGSVYLVIDNTNITVYSATGSQYQTFTHGLNLQDFISVNIKVADSPIARANITISTNGGESVTENVIFFGSNGDIYASSASAMTDVKFQYIVPDMKKDVFVFGDSYTSLADNARWPYHLLSKGYTNMLINGFGGATSADAIIAFNNILNVQKPKYLIWLLGMNDGDKAEINSSWKNTVDTVITYCENYNITLILATIPNTPTVNNTFKNDYVRNSGYRYVDFAKAVNAESQGAPWYEGMLYEDNVHTTEKGAKALASRFLIDVPELID